MCMPTNFGIRKKHSAKFQRRKKSKQKDDFFCDAESFLKDNKNENSNIKS